MKNNFLFTVIFFFQQAIFAQNISIIPEPVSIIPAEGYFAFQPGTYMLANDFNSFLEANSARDLFIRFYNLPIKPATKKIGEGNNIILKYDSTLNIEDGGYILIVEPNQITITGKNKGGVFYGLMSLLQMTQYNSSTDIRISCCTITDYPRFSYRGMHLDCARHFFDVDFIKKYIDYLALYKMNTFHWHLTDDQGWRLEIKQYPKLTEVGAWRNGSMTGHYRNQEFDTIRYGGFYTQADIKEIVQYASKRNITIIPEIEMPGHCLAALASYPQYGCIDTTLEVGKAWGTYPDVFCPSEETFTFLEHILDEVIELFPSKYIHIGGDEVEKTKWKQNAFCQKLIIDSNLVDENGLQSYFIRRIEKYLESKGKKIIGWDEILEGGIAPDATVMSWQGEDGGIAAAQSGHNAIMTPGQYCYFNYYQSSPSVEPLAIGGYTPIEKVYNYEPVPTVLNSDEAKYILGAQGNLWTEYIYSSKQVEYMTIPRMLALSEVLWSPIEKRNYNDFVERLQLQFNLLDRVQCNYSKSIYNVEYNVEPLDDRSGVSVELHSNIRGKAIYNECYPDFIYVIDKYEKFGAPEYTGPIAVKENMMIDTRSYLSGRNTQIFIHFNKATGKKITLANQPSKKYAGDGAFTLVNGIEGTIDPSWSGNEWLGFSGTNMIATIDLGSKDSISTISASFLVDKLSWIWPPDSLEVLVSDGGRNFTSVAKIKFDTNEGSRVINTILIDKQMTRFVRVIATNYGEIPPGNPGAGFKPWLFADEISIQ